MAANRDPLLIIDRPTTPVVSCCAAWRIGAGPAGNGQAAAESWVFPKGHIEPGENVEQAAIREVEEEAGVIATVGEPIGTLEFRNARGVVRAQFFVMAFVSEDAPREGRRRGWFTAEEARQALGYEDSRMLVVRAKQAWSDMALGASSE
jgi:diadenosine hexaphosphate hydrolase (ATP-forming)